MVESYLTKRLMITNFVSSDIKAIIYLQMQSVDTWQVNYNITI